MKAINPKLQREVFRGGSNCRPLGPVKRGWKDVYLRVLASSHSGCWDWGLSQLGTLGIYPDQKGTMGSLLN